MPLIGLFLTRLEIMNRTDDIPAWLFVRLCSLQSWAIRYAARYRPYDTVYCDTYLFIYLLKVGRKIMSWYESSKHMALPIVALAMPPYTPCLLQEPDNEKLLSRQPTINHCLPQILHLRFVNYREVYPLWKISTVLQCSVLSYLS